MSPDVSGFFHASECQIIQHAKLSKINMQPYLVFIGIMLYICFNKKRGTAI